MTKMMSRTYGVVIGLVADVDDPDKLGRIRVTYPWLGSGADQATSKWISIAVPLAGKDRGFYYLPEVDDEVLVAFDHGDVDHPFVIGFLHNGADTPPLDGIDKHVRRIKSVSGHIIDLDDRDGAEKVSVKTQGGHSLEMRDGDTTIEVATNGGQEITMTDSPAQIEVKTSTGTSVTISDSPSQVEVRTVAGVSLTISDTGVTLNAATAPVSVTAMSADVTAASALNVTAPAVTLNSPALIVDSGIATFSGVVVCSTLISGSVVSASYSPGVGNLL
jgi:uncharacterized protein involved in type VI secretion and phage assembly